jgi:hypothetical protein
MKEGFADAKIVCAAKPLRKKTPWMKVQNTDEKKIK